MTKLTSKLVAAKTTDLTVGFAVLVWCEISQQCICGGQVMSS
jgi:uncharacterized protein YheU (UPF0270 family)